MNTIFFKTFHKRLYCFIALFLVAVLGSGMFLSLLSLPESVETSLNNYINDSNLMDVKLTSTIGFSSADVHAVEMMKDVDAVMPVSTVNAFMSVEENNIKTDSGQKATAKVFSLDVDLAESNDKKNINRLELTSGRYPENDEECVVDTAACNLKGLKLGSKITLVGDGTDIFSYISKNTFTVVGTVNVPTYLSKNLGAETVGSGELNALVYITDSVFVTDNYTELYVRLKGLDDYNYSGNKYFTAIQKFSEEALSLGDDRIEARAQLIEEIAKKEVERDKAEIEAFEATFKKELADSQKKLDEISSLADGGDEKIAKKEEEIQKSISETQKKILERKKEFTKTSDEYIADLAQYNVDREEYSINRSVFVENFNIANTNLPIHEERLNKVKAVMAEQEKKIALNQQVVDSYSDPSLVPDFDNLLANLETNGLEKDFVKYMERCAADTSKTLGKLSLSQQQIEYATKKIEFRKVSAVYNECKAVVDSYAATSAELIKQENDLIERQKDLDARKDFIEKENEDILTGEAAISNETFKLKLELEELKIKISDAIENKAAFQAEHTKLETEGNAKIENLNRALETNTVLLNNSSAASWDVSDVRSIQGYDSLSSTVSTVSSVSKIPAVLALVLTAIVCVVTLLKYAHSENDIHKKLMFVGITKQSIAKSYLTAYIPISLLSVLSGVVFTTYILPVIAKNVLSIQYTIPTIDIPVPVKDMIISAVVLSVIVPIVFSFVFTYTRYEIPKSKKSSTVSALKKRNFKRTVIATALSLVLALTSGGLLLGNHLATLAGPSKAEGIVYDALADFAFPMEEPDKSVFAETPVKESLFARRYSVTGTVNYDLFIIQDAKKLPKFILTDDNLNDNGVIISKRLSETFGKKAGDVLQMKLPDGTTGKFEIIGISDNSVQPIMYITEKKYEENFKTQVTYNCAFLTFNKSKLSVEKIDEEIMKNAAVSKVTSTKAIDAELTLNNSISNTILISVCAISVMWSVLCFIAMSTADIRKKKIYRL